MKHSYLQSVINNSIYSYPTLFRVPNDPKLSRIKVLEHMFLSYGTGYEWDRYMGIMICDENRNPIPELPEGFYEKELYTVDLTPEKLNDFEEFMGDTFCYTLGRKEFDPRAVFEADEKTAEQITLDWGKENIGKSFNKYSYVYVNDAKTEFDFTPYPMCNYSPLCELASNQPNAVNGEPFNFDDYPAHPEWLDGCAEVAQAALEYYKHPNKLTEHNYYGTKGWKKFVREQRDYCDDFLIKYGYKDEKQRENNKWLIGRLVGSWGLAIWERYRRGMDRLQRSWRSMRFPRS